MTKQEVLDAANVMIAYANGKKVGTRPRRSMEPLLKILYVPTWNWEQKDYFVIPDDCSKKVETDDVATALAVVREMKERIKRLEAAGDELSDCADQIGWTSCESPQWIKKAENAVKEWRKAKEAKL